MGIVEIAKSLVQRMVTLVLISLTVFLLISSVPGSPILQSIRRSKLSSTQIAQLEHIYGLDKPVMTRYFTWAKEAIQGNLGYSLLSGQPVSTLILSRLPNTVVLMLVSLVLVLLCSLPLGIYASLNPSSGRGALGLAVAFIAQSIPSYWLGTLLLVSFYGLLTNPLTHSPLFPPGGAVSLVGGGGLADRIWHMILPITALSVPWIATYVIIVRASLLETVGQTYVLTAKAKGLRDREIVVRHMLRNVAPIWVTILAMDLPALFAGAYYVEFVFSWPGMGRLFQEAAVQRDYPVLMGIVFLSSVLVVMANFTADILQAVLDPRTK